MSRIDEDTRDVLAGLSFYVGHTLPSALIPAAKAHGARACHWTYPADSDVPTTTSGHSGQRLSELGRSLRDRANAAGISMLIRGDAG